MVNQIRHILREPLRAPLAALVILTLGSVATGETGGLVEESLASRSQPTGSTLFTTLLPEETGIVTVNHYADPRMWWELYQEFSVGPMGTGVAIDDFDRDGRPDIFIVSKTESCRLFRNLGDWRFEDVTETAGLVDRGEDAAIWKQGATFADVDNDGWPDLHLSRFGAPNRLYMNQGDGTFREEAKIRGLGVSSASGVAVFGDYDRDGWLDLYLQTNLLDVRKEPNGQPDHLFHNDGDGRFTEVTRQAGISGRSQGHSASWWDFDQDLWPDLYVANDFAPPDHLYRNNRDGTFTDIIDHALPHTPYSSMGSDLGDVNNDGRIDFLVADMSATTHETDQRGMADSRARSASRDGSTDITPQNLRNALYLNTGTGQFLEAARLAGLAATDWTWSVRWEDLDNDGRLDLHVTNGMNREQHNSDLLMGMMTAESPVERLSLMRDSPVLKENNLAFRNLGELRFARVESDWGLDRLGVSFGTAFGDLDGDGDLDLVHTNYEAGPSVYRNDSTTGHRAMIRLQGTLSNPAGIGALVAIETGSGRQIRQLTLVRGYLSNSEPMVHFGLGEDTTIKRLTVSWPSGHVQVFEDLAVDRRFTITEPDAPITPARDAKPVPPGLFEDVSRQIKFALPSREAASDGTMPQPLLPIRLHRRGPALAAGDLTGDGLDDVVMGGTPLDPTRILVAGLSAPFTPVSPPGFSVRSPISDGPVLIFDADGNGANDVLVTKGGANLPAGAPIYQPKLFFNTGRGLAPAPAEALPNLTGSVGAAVAADFDRDGRLDLFIGARVLPGLYPLPPRSSLLLNRGGRFVDVTDSLAPGLSSIGMVTSALWSDADGDGWLDLFVTLEWGGVRYWHNRAGHGFEDLSAAAGFAAAGSGWWTSLATADFNQDGRPDYAVGNLGLNTLYQPDAEHPSLLFFGDFSGQGSEQIVEGFYEGERLYPQKTRRELGSKIRPVLKGFPHNDDYARATLDEIVGQDALDRAEKFSATEARSGVFISQSDGTWRFEPLPRIAQIAPLQGIVTGDFNGDGHPDLHALQNMFAPDLSIGRFDGGLSQLLLGDGRGGFTAVPPIESGLIIPGDAKALLIGDLDGNGWPDLLASRNNATTLAFRNRGIPGHQALRITLKGKPGNPTAIGARVSIVLTDGAIQTGEILAGSGLISQSGAACFFGYPETNPPREIRIRWPSGQSSTHPFEPGMTVLEFALPLDSLHETSINEPVK